MRPCRSCARDAKGREGTKNAAKIAAKIAAKAAAKIAEGNAAGEERAAAKALYNDVVKLFFRTIPAAIATIMINFNEFRH